MSTWQSLTKERRVPWVIKRIAMAISAWFVSVVLLTPAAAGAGPHWLPQVLGLFIAFCVWQLTGRHLERCRQAGNKGDAALYAFGAKVKAGLLALLPVADFLIVAALVVWFVSSLPWVAFALAVLYLLAVIAARVR